MKGIALILLSLFFVPVLAGAAASPSPRNDQQVQPIRIIFPSEGDTLIAGKTYRIVWVGTLPTDTDIYVNMHGGSLGGGRVFIGRVIPPNRSIRFTVPNLPGSDYFISLSGKAWYEQSGSFSII